LPVNILEEDGVVLVLKWRLIANLDASGFQGRSCVTAKPRWGSIAAASRGGKRTHRILAESSWVNAMLGGADPIDKLVKTFSQGGRFDEILYPLLTLAKLDRLLVSDIFGSSQNGRDGKLM